MIPEYKELTEEQVKSVNKLLWKAKLSLFFIGLKFSLGLFVANLFCAVVGYKLLKDADPSMMDGFLTVSMVVNTIFMFLYFIDKFKKNNSDLADKIKQILEQNKSE